MTDTEHPDTEYLIGYSEQPESTDFQAVGLHLAGCGQCRKDLQALSSLRRHAGWISANANDTSADISFEVADLIHKRLSDQEAGELRDRINQNPADLYQALHYARHHAAMKNHIKKPQVTVPVFSWLDSAKYRVKALLQIETPAWKLIPVAFVLIAIVTVFNSVLVEPSSVKVAKVFQFEEQSVIEFVAQESQPGIGFFASSARTTKPFDGVTVLLINDREIAFSWPAIKEATSYQLKLQVFRNGEMVVLGRVSGKETNAVIRLPEPPGQHRYEWVLTGDTINAQSFQASGGFMVAG